MRNLTYNSRCIVPLSESAALEARRDSDMLALREQQKEKLRTEIEIAKEVQKIKGTNEIEVRNVELWKQLCPVTVNLGCRRRQRRQGRRQKWT
eukprot:SAG31_NODE_1858_length_7061_cov_60.221201_7_plen_93_part_00